MFSQTILNYEIPHLNKTTHRNYANSNYHYGKLPKWVYLLSMTIQHPVHQTVTLVAYVWGFCGIKNGLSQVSGDYKA